MASRKEVDMMKRTIMWLVIVAILFLLWLTYVVPSTPAFLR